MFDAIATATDNAGRVLFTAHTVSRKPQAALAAARRRAHEIAAERGLSRAVAHVAVEIA
jgi:hypothetical protein